MLSILIYLITYLNYMLFIFDLSGNIIHQNGCFRAPLVLDSNGAIKNVFSSFTVYKNTHNYIY